MLYNQKIVDKALQMVSEKMFSRDSSGSFTSPNASMDYLRLKLSEKKNEVFAVLFLDNAHNVIKYEELFQGTINGASVYPRVVAQKCLEYNAAAIIMAHNHPSGTSDPSRADKNITSRLVTTMELIDVRILDHIIVGKDEASSFANLGLI